LQYYTYCNKFAHCPKWDIDISLRGKYRFSDNPETPNTATFLYATCPIVENSKLPIHKQEPELKLMRCPESDSCQFLQEFKPVIDIDKDGYSQ